MNFHLYCLYTPGLEPATLYHPLAHIPPVTTFKTGRPSTWPGAPEDQEVAKPEHLTAEAQLSTLAVFGLQHCQAYYHCVKEWPADKLPHPHTGGHRGLRKENISEKQSVWRQWKTRYGTPLVTSLIAGTF